MKFHNFPKYIHVKLECRNIFFMMISKRETKEIVKYINFSTNF